MGILSDADSIPAAKNKPGFTQAIASEKHERVARRSLHDLVVFHQAVVKELQHMTDGEAKGIQYDSDLFERMTIVDNHYKRVMTGFLELDDNGQRHALIVFADAVQDLMKHIHVRKAS